MLADVIPYLRCPTCRAPVSSDGRSIRCEARHAFDVARQGYVSFAVGRPTGLVGDDAAMVAARARFLAAGHLAPLAEALAALAERAGAGLVVEVGAGTGYHLARVLEALPAHAGLALDLSKHAARRAARAHTRIGAVVTDVRGVLPVADGCASLVLDVFAPRNGAELRRILGADGLLAVATPAPEHLAELRAPLGLLDVDPEKERRVAGALSPWFERASESALSWRMRLSRADAASLVAMGPSARHLDASAIARRSAALPGAVGVTASVRIEGWRPRAGGGEPSGARRAGGVTSPAGAGSSSASRAGSRCPSPS